MASTEPKQSMITSNGIQKRQFMAQFVLRIAAIASAIASILTMVTSHQTVLIFGFYTTARYRYSCAYRFLVGADAVASGFGAVSLFFVWRLRSSKIPHFRSYFYLYLHDLVMTVLVATGCAAATAIGYVGRYGEEKINWNSVCDYVGKFCNQILASILLSYLSFFCLFSLTILSVIQLISIPK